MAQSALVCPTLVGRDSQLDDLVAVSARLHRHEGQILLVSGEAGIGKSPLVAEACARLRAESATGLLLLRGRCFEFDQMVPYAPLLDLLRDLLAREDGAARARAIATVAPRLARLLPELAPVVPEGALAPPVAPEAEKFELFWALTHCLLSFTAEQPVVVVIEDLHWCDETSLQFLLTLVPRVRTVPLALLLTFRTDQEPRHLRTFLAGIARERLAQEIRVGALDEEGIARMARAILANQEHPLDPSRPPPVTSLPDNLKAVLLRLTDGNPFFVEETISALLASGDLQYRDGVWYCHDTADAACPLTVQEAVQRRVALLAPATQELVALMAALGRRWSFAMLQQVTGRDEAMLLEQVKELIAAALLVEESPDVLAFRHAMTRQAIYAPLLSRERQALHRQIVSALLVSNTPVPVSDLATHCAAGGMWEQTLDYARQAGDQARMLAAPSVAVEHYSRAIAAARLLNLPPPLDLHRDRAMMCQLAGDRELALRDYHLIEIEAARAGDRQRQWQNDLDLGYFYTAEDFPLAITYLERASEHSHDLGDPAIVARTLNRIGNWCANSEQPDDALRYHQAALDTFRDLADQSGIAATYDLIATAGYVAGDFAHAVVAYQNAIARWRELADRGGLISSLGMFALCRVPAIAGVLPPVPITMAACQQAAEETLALAQAAQWRPEEAFAHCVMAFTLDARGAYTRAHEHAIRALEIATMIGHPYFITFSQAALGIAALDTLDLVAAREHLAATLHQAEQIGSRFWIGIASALLARAACAQGSVDDAAATLGVQTPGLGDVLTLSRRHLLVAHVELALARRRADAALDLLARLPATDGALVPLPAGLRAEALVRLRRPAEARAVAVAALEVANSREMLWDYWRLLRALGQAQHALGVRQEARATFARLRTHSTEIASGMAPGPEREHLLSAILALMPGGRPREDGEPALPHGLTAREWEVARQIAQGKSNRTIATELILSERTVEKYVERILAKLGAATRVNIAAFVVARDERTRLP